jgi:gliding motility-associated-like protein
MKRSILSLALIAALLAGGSTLPATNNCKMYIPNAFSPNGDGRNDLFKPETNCTVTDYELRIFSRWGQLLFESRSIEAGWDGALAGKPMPQGVYVYRLRYSVEDGDRPRETVASGQVTLLR